MSDNKLIDNLTRSANKLFAYLIKIIVFIFVFYLTITLILLPIAGKYIIQSQGKKLIKQDVSLGSIVFNPFLLRLSLNQFNIMSTEKQYLGFDSFAVDLSFLSLLKKELRIESILLSGLNINAELMEEGNLDLLALIPEISKEKTESETKDVKPIPSNLFMDLFELTSSTISFTDKSISPQYKLDISNIDIKLTDFSTQIDSVSKLFFNAQLGSQSGLLETELILKLMNQPIEADLFFNIKDYDLTTLSPYVGKFTGNAVESGRFNLRIDTQIAQEKIRSNHKVNIQSFDFGDKVSSEDALNLPFGLALAILEDRNNRIKISLPVKGEMSDPEFEYWPLVGKVCRNFFMKIVTKPFSFLASMAGLDSSASEELSYIRFEPARSELIESEREKIRVLVNALADRPKLTIGINGAYDPEIDVFGVREDLFNKRFAELKEKSGQSDYRVLYALYRKKYGVFSAWNAIKKYRKEISEETMDEKEPVRKGFKDTLVKETSTDIKALSLLADDRARAIYNFFIAQGFDSSRLSIGKSQKAQASVGYIPSKFTLKIKNN